VVVASLQFQRARLRELGVLLIVGSADQVSICESSGEVRSADAQRVLVIGFGNVSRRDDGAAFHVITRLRERLGFDAEPDAIDAEEAPMGDRLSTIFLHQLAPEIVESLIRYDLVVFVDAHVEGVGWDDVHWQDVEVAYRSGMVSHHLKPSSTLALCRTLYQRCPEAKILSILGTDFDFGEDLSTGTGGLVNQAVGELLSELESRQAIG